MSGSETGCYGRELVFGLGRVSVQRGWVLMGRELYCLLLALGSMALLRGLCISAVHFVYISVMSVSLSSSSISSPRPPIRLY